MSLKTINTNLKEQQGFTIVELLIVIVVIAILAAITIVSYNGITARANTSSAQSAASTVIKKVEAFSADTNTTGYPTATSALTGASASNAPYQVTGVTFDSTILSSSNLPSTPSEVNLFRCPGTGTIVGMRVGYWDYSTGSIQYINTGTQTSCATTPM